MQLPEPLTPPDCNLRGLRWMPLDVSRVLDSDLFLISSGAEFKAAFALWAKSWSQVPAGSLPNDERILGGLSGAKDWKRVREVALRGWILCADGRLYHPVIAEKALEAMSKREDHAEREENEQSRQQRLRARRKAMFEQLREHGIVPAYDTKTAELERLIASLPTVTPETQSVTTGDAGDVTGDAPATAIDTHRTGQDITKTIRGDTHAVGTPVRASELSSAMRRHSIEAQPGDPRIIAAAAAGVTVATIEAACVQAKAAKPNQRIPPNYVVQTAMNWTAEATASRPSARASPQRAANHHDERAHTIAVLTGRSRDDNQPDEPYTIDAGHTRIG